MPSEILVVMTGALARRLALLKRSTPVTTASPRRTGESPRWLRLGTNETWNAASRGELEKPVALGIIGPGATLKLAKERAVPYAQQAVRAVHGLLKK